jgi:hypothetical protein
MEPRSLNTFPWGSKWSQQEPINKQKQINTVESVNADEENQASLGLPCCRTRWRSGKRNASLNGELEKLMGLF